MSDYMKLVKQEATDFYKANKEVFSEDAEEFGGKSGNPNLLRWLDRTEKLAQRVGEIAANWGLKEHRWVQANTRNRAKGGGDAGGHAFASFLQDVRHEIKKLSKK